MHLNPRKYKFKIGLKGYDERIHYGFIAQDIEDIAKKLNLGNLSLVYKEKCDADLSNEMDIIGDQYVYRVDKDELHAMHVQMIQRQEKEIEQLRMSNCTLNGEIEILKQRIERLEEKLC